MFIINKIIELFYPWTNDSKDFVLKNKPSSSIKIRYVLYSCNGGKTFKKIYCAKEPLFTHGENVLKFDWTFKPLIFNAERQAFADFRHKFKCIEDVRSFELQEYRKYLDGQKDILIKRTKYIQNLNRNIH